MNTPEEFVNWLEGFLDACKNAPTSAQIKEVRKKITSLRSNQEETYTALWGNHKAPAKSFPTVTLVQSKNEEQLSDEFLKAIEENKTASTMEELNS